LRIVAELIPQSNPSIKALEPTGSAVAM
jgi:hypothetical protein